MVDYKRTASETIDRERDELRALSNEIWQNPELAFKEYKAVSALTGFLKKRGFTVTSPYCELDTSFKAEITGTGSEGAHVCIICEYDALPDIGHACGHNLIAEAGVAAGLGIQAAIEQGLAGRLTVMGTPAEEECGGKILLIDRGAFNGIDIAMMVHPAPHNAVYSQYLAISTIHITYTGKASHAAAFPWEGLNALDAAVMAYNMVSVARQQFKPTWRVHGIITNGGVKPNIIPEETSLEYYIRAPTVRELNELSARMVSCFESAAKATGCSLQIKKPSENYENVLTNPVIADLYRDNLASLGITEMKDWGPAGSTDMGNVTHVVPGIHPKYAIGSGEVNHSVGFTAVANTVESHEKTLTVAKGMAHTCIDILRSPEVLERVKAKFEEQKNIE